MKKFTKKGSALLQVLVLSALISTIVVILLKFSVTRTGNMVQTKTIVGSKLAMQSCMSILAEEEINRINTGRPPYFEENESYICNIPGYDITITREPFRNNSAQDHATGVVRELKFKVRFF